MTDESWKPVNVEGVVECLAWALAEEEPVEIAGAGTKSGWGRPVERRRRLDLTGLAGVRLYEPEELVLTAAAGTPMAELEALLAQRRQHFAFEPGDLGPFFDGATGKGTIGGAIGCNLSGPRRVKAGAARDHILGVVAVSGRAERFRAGGRVVKNVTGYDVPKLLTGSFGTLAVAVEITMKVLPAPEAEVTLIIEGLDEYAAVKALTLALRSPHDVSGAAHVPVETSEGGAAETMIRVEGFEKSVAARVAALRQDLSHSGAVRSIDGAASAVKWRRLADLVPFVGSGEAVWRVSVAPNDGPQVATRIRAGLPDARLLFDWGGGLLHVGVPASTEEGGAFQVRGALAGIGGHATLLRGAPELRRQVEVFHPQATALAALSRRVKASFDPSDILNRGRLWPPR